MASLSLSKTGQFVNVDVNVGNSDSYFMRASIYLTSQNQANRTSTLTIKYYWAHHRDSTLSGTTVKYVAELGTISGDNVVTIGGHKAYYTKFTGTVGSPILLATKKVTVTHNADGTFKKSFTTRAGYGSTPTSVAGGSNYRTDTLTLPKIPVSSGFTVNTTGTFVVGTTKMSITVSPGSSSWTHKIWISSSSSGSGTVVQLSTLSAGTTKATITIPNSVASNLMPNSKSKTLYVACQAFTGNTGLGIKTVARTFSIPETSTFLPTMSVAISPVGTSDIGYVASVSRVRVVASNISTKQNSSLSSISSKISGSSTTYYLQKDSNQNTYSVNYSNPISTSGTVTILTTITDTRGLKSTYENKITVKGYSAPRIVTLSGYRSDDRGNVDTEGSYLHVELHYTISSLILEGEEGSSNSIVLNGTESWTQVSNSTTFYMSLNDLVKSEDYLGILSCTSLNVVTNDTIVLNNLNTISGYSDQESQAGQNRIYINVGATDLSGLISYLSENNITVDYYTELPNEHNGYKYKLEYKKESDLNYTVVPGEDTTSADYRYRPMSVSKSVNILVGDISNNYNIRFTIYDRLLGNSGKAVKEYTILPSGNVFFNFRSDGLGLGIGKLAALQGGLDIGWKTRFSKGVVYASLPANTSINSVTTPGFYEGSTSIGNTGLPTGVTGGFGLIVKSIYDKVLQELSSSTGSTYTRVYDGTSWGSWSGSNAVDSMYPIGSVYISVINSNPANLFPGTTWKRIGAGRFLVSAGASGTYIGKGSNVSAEDNTGGHDSVTMPSHRHLAPIGSNGNAVGAISINGTVSSGSGKAYRTAVQDYSGTLSSNVTMWYTGNRVVNTSDGSLSIATVPPWIAAYMWYRLS